MSDPQRPHGLQPSRLLHLGIFQAGVLEWGAIAFSAPTLINFISLSFCLMSGNSFPTCTRTMTGSSDDCKRFNTYKHHTWYAWIKYANIYKFTLRCELKFFQFMKKVCPKTSLVEPVCSIKLSSHISFTFYSEKN